MTLPSQPSAVSEQELVDLIRSEVFGQDAVIQTFAAEFVRRYRSHPADRPVGVFLVAGPNDRREQLSIAGSLNEVLHAGLSAHDLSSTAGQDPELLFLSVPGNPVTLVDDLKAHPGSVVVLIAIERAHPQVIEKLLAAWRTGVIRDYCGMPILIAGATFVLTTEAAQRQIGRLARDETDPDRLHVESLKLLLDTGFPAS